jgi:branched-chain amino acid transport system substrate-binding protein
MAELMRISPEASEDVVAQALEEVRPVVAILGANELSGLLADAGVPGPVFPPFQVEYGVALYFQGASEEAADLGRAALAAGAVDPEEELARALVSGRVEDALGGQRTIGALLPSSGPPTLTRFGTLLEEGVRIALEEQRTLDRRPVQVLIEDDGGSVANLESLVPDLESRGVSALIGPLLDDAVAAAGTLRQREFPIVSPTARDIPPGMRGVYSLMGPDPSGPRALADWAARNGIGRVVIMHPTEPASSFESQVFRDQFTQSGGQVLEELLFPVGATFFEEFLRQVEELAPDALVLPLQAPAIELVAPQVTFYGLDTLGIQILGTDAWTSDAVLQTIDPRHTNGVIASTTLPGGLPGPAARRFRERYEEIHRQTLRSEVPALGYDAAGILLEGIRAGASSGEDLLAFLETLDGFEGATGRLSVEDGRLVRSHYLVRLENRTMLPVF